MENVFETKEQAVAFKKKWKQLYKDGFHTPKKHPIISFPYNKETRQYEETIMGYYKASDLDASFHLMYAVALGRDLKRGFGKSNKYKIGTKLYHHVTSNRAVDKPFEIFGDLLTEEQKMKINEGMVAFAKSLW